MEEHKEPSYFLKGIFVERLVLEECMKDRLDSTEERTVLKAFLEAEKSSRAQSHNSKSNIIWDAG